MPKIYFTDRQSRIPNPPVIRPKSNLNIRKQKPPRRAADHREARHNALKNWLHYICNPASSPRAYICPYPEDGSAKLIPVRNQLQFVINVGTSNVTGYSGVPTPVNFILPLGMCQGQDVVRYASDVTGMTADREDLANAYTSPITLGSGMATTNGSYERGRCTAIEVKVQFMGPPSTATGRVFVAKCPGLGSWGVGVKTANAADIRGHFNRVCGPAAGSEYDVYTAAEVYQRGGIVLKYIPSTREEFLLLANTTSPGAQPTDLWLPQSGIGLTDGAKGISISDATALVWGKMWFADMQAQERIQVTVNICGDLDVSSYTNTGSSGFANIAGRQSIPHPNTLPAAQFCALRHHTGDTTTNAQFHPSTSTAHGRNTALAALDLHTLYGDAMDTSVPNQSGQKRKGGAGSLFKGAPVQGVGIKKTKVLYSSQGRSQPTWSKYAKFGKKAFDDILYLVNKGSRAVQGELGDRRREAVAGTNDALEQYQLKQEMRREAIKDAIKEKFTKKFRYRKPGIANY